MTKLNINVIKIDKTAIYKGKNGNGKYLNLVLFENRGGKDQYGNDGFIVQELSKEQREAGNKGPIVGSWKRFEPLNQTPIKRDDEQNEDDEIPF